MKKTNSRKKTERLKRNYRRAGMKKISLKTKIIEWFKNYKKEILLITFFLLFLISSAFFALSLSYVLYFLISKNFGLILLYLMVIAAIFFYLAISIILIIKSYFKANNWFLFSIFISIILVMTAIAFLDIFFYPHFPTGISHYSDDYIDMSYNVINPEIGHSYALLGDSLCFNMSIENKFTESIKIYIKSKIKTPYSNFIGSDYDIWHIDPNRTKGIKECMDFNVSGENRFYLYFFLEFLNETRTQIISPPGYYIPVKTSTEYEELLYKKYFYFLLALAIIPIVVSTMTNLRRLYKNEF